ncbi:MAG: type II toxin-antitoxin system RelE/ParE family toxin [Spirosomaceae bacterium]|jgi:mRNA-degrading endonuclease RelE of RelBE toxin-antitoxin system|nr:type II toxin-antitoxin system RelE/ParE family toxin [Spirosomataceae bacterium]
MNFEIEALPEFERELKKLSKKYFSIKSDYHDLLESLLDNPLQGTPLGRNLYKIRMPISSKRQDKSGGARVITCVKIVNEKIFLVAIYDKSEMDNISDVEISERLKSIDYRL